MPMKFSPTTAVAAALVTQYHRFVTVICRLMSIRIAYTVPATIAPPLDWQAVMSKFSAWRPLFPGAAVFCAMSTPPSWMVPLPVTIVSPAGLLMATLLCALTTCAPADPLRLIFTAGLVDAPVPSGAMIVALVVAASTSMSENVPNVIVPDDSRRYPIITGDWEAAAPEYWPT